MNDGPLPIPEPDQVLDQELDHELDQELYQESEQELKQELEPEDTNLSYPIPGDWPEDSPDTLEPTSGPAGWLKALTSPAV
jgi:hypothetical protein